MREGFIQRGGLWVIVQSSLMLSVAAVGVLDRWRFDPFPFQFAIALSLFVVATIVGIAGVVTLGKSRSAFPQPRAGGELVQRGIYGLIRHPLYTSVILWGLSWSLFWRSGAALAVTLVMAVFFDAKARHEERLLINRFSDYAGYKLRVRRFIPRLY